MTEVSEVARRLVFWMDGLTTTSDNAGLAAVLGEVLAIESRIAALAWWLWSVPSGAPRSSPPS